MAEEPQFLGGAEKLRDQVGVVGVGMTRFGKFPEQSLKSMVKVAVTEALRDAGLEPKDIGAAFGSNSLAGLITGQESVRTQTVLGPLGIRGIPMASVENACASGSTAFRMAVQCVGWGEAKYALAVGFEKMAIPDKQRTFDAIGTSQDLDEAVGSGPGRSSFMDIYAEEVRQHMSQFGSTAKDFAMVASKNHRHGALNPYAQYRHEISVEEVLESPMVVDPLTRLMCSPIGDGAAAVILGPVSAGTPVVASTVLRSGTISITAAENDSVKASKEAYELAGIGPGDIDVAEVHDAAAPAELISYEDLGFAPRGEGARLIRDGETELGGKLPVNTSGGLESRGHPIGATGVAMIVEIVEQLRGRAGERQVDGARVGLVQNNGGLVNDFPAVVAVHVLRAP